MKLDSQICLCIQDVAVHLKILRNQKFNSHYSSAYSQTIMISVVLSFGIRKKFQWLDVAIMQLR